MRNCVILIGCLMLGSCKVRPAAFMPSASVAYFSDRVEASSDGAKVSAFEAPATEFPKELLKSPKELLKEDLQIGSTAPESVAAESVVAEKGKAVKPGSPKIIFHNEVARPDSIPDLRKTEPLGIVAALTGVTAGIGLLANYRLFQMKGVILLVMLATGASLGIASLVRIGDEPRRFKGRFGGWLSIFLASLPILYFLLIPLGYK